MGLLAKITLNNQMIIVLGVIVEKQFRLEKIVMGPKLKSVVAIAAAVLLGLLLLQVSYLLTPQPEAAYIPTSQTLSPMPVPSTESQIFAATLWIGFAVLVSVSAVGMFVLVQRVGKRTKSSV